MTWEMETVTQQVARKDYLCDASVLLMSATNFDERVFEQSEIGLLRESKASGLKILKGERYMKVSGKWEGEFAVFRSRIGLDVLCAKYGAYDE